MSLSVYSRGDLKSPREFARLQITKLTTLTFKVSDTLGLHHKVDNSENIKKQLVA
jgi:hypothetical protein